MIEKIIEKAKSINKKIVLPEGYDVRVLEAADILQREGIAKPIVLGNKNDIQTNAANHKIDLTGIQLIDPAASPDHEDYSREYYNLRKHKGITFENAKEIMVNPLFFGAMLVRKSKVHCSLAGADHATGDVIRAALQIIGLAEGISTVSSFFLMIMPDGKAYTFADCAVMPDPNVDQLAEIAICSAASHKAFTGEEPKVAMLSFSTKGSATHPDVEKVLQATEAARQLAPDVDIDGEMQLDTAIVEKVASKKAPGSPVGGKANVLVFPDLNSGNIGYKLVQRLGGAQAIGPILQGLKKPANDLSRGCSTEDIVKTAAMSVVLSSINDK